MQAVRNEMRQSIAEDERAAARYRHMDRRARGVETEDSEEQGENSEEAEGSEEDLISLEDGLSEGEKDEPENDAAAEESSEEEEDEWMKSKLNRRLPSGKTLTPRKRGSRRVSLSGSASKRRESSVPGSGSSSVPASSVRKRLVIHDSDDDE
jgi:hypothetical protein